VAPLLVALVLIALLGRRMMRPRRFRVASAFIAPCIILVAAIAVLAHRPAPTALHIGVLLAMLIAGGAVGWLRAKTVKIEYDPASGLVTQRGTPYGLVLLIGLFALRAGFRILAVTHPQWGLDLNDAADVLLVFALGLVSGLALVLYVQVAKLRAAPLPAP
jgi:hypothetical protein